MKNVIRFLSLTLLFIAMGCNSSEAYKEQVDTLNKNWKSTTEALMALSQSAEKELNDWNEMYAGMYGQDRTSDSEMPEDQKRTLDSLDAVCKSHGDRYKLMNQEISELKELWVQNTKIVEDINSKFENNTLASDNLDAINRLNEQTGEVNEQINTWKNNMESIGKECESTCQAAAAALDED